MSHNLPHRGNPSATKDIVNHAWVCYKKYQARSSKELSITLSSRGEVTKWDPANPAWVHVINRDTKPIQQGWVPLDRITVGSGRCDQPIKVKDHGTFDSNILDSTLQQSVAGFPSTGTLERGVSAFLIALNENLDKSGLTNVMDRIRAKINSTPKNLAATARRIIDGVRAAGQYDVLSGQGFTADDLARAPQKLDLRKISPEPARVGVYCLVYEDKDGKRACYIGKSINMVQRFRDHRRNTFDSEQHEYRRYHYQVARQAEQYFAVVVCCLKPKDAQDGTLAIAEQVFVSLLESYRTELMNFRPSGTDEATAWLEDYEQAQTLCSIAAEAKQKSHWPGGIISRPDALTIHTGLNWSSPICEACHFKNVWVRTEAEFDDPEDPTRKVKVANFRLSKPKRAPGPSRKIWSISRDPRPSLDLLFPSLDPSLKALPKTGSFIQLFAEIRMGEYSLSSSI